LHKRVCPLNGIPVFTQTRSPAAYLSLFTGMALVLDA